MTTLAIMKARIADEIYRDDLTSAIDREIKSAIQYYQSRNLYFQEAYTFNFSTVAGQESYGFSTSPNLANLVSIDFVHVVENGSVHPLKWVDPGRMDQFTFLPSSGVPSMYTYMASTLRLNPIPDQVLTIRIGGIVPVGAPAADDTEGSPWMYDAEELIRSRAKRNLYLHSLGDQGMAAVMKAAEDEAYDALLRETSSRTQVHSFAPYCV